MLSWLKELWGRVFWKYKIMGESSDGEDYYAVFWTRDLDEAIAKADKLGVVAVHNRQGGVVYKTFESIF